MVERHSKAMHAQAERGFRETPILSDALHTLDIIDAKVGVLIQFVGVMIAAVLIFIAGGAGNASFEIGVISIQGLGLIFIALILLTIAALIALSCVWIINYEVIAKKEQKKAGYMTARILSVTRSRRARYKFAFCFTFLGLLASIAAITASLAQMPRAETVAPRYMKSSSSATNEL